MGKLKITSRQKQIISIIIENGNKPITIKDISIELNVSSRTIVRELPFIEEFLFENDFKFVKKSGVGIYINEDSEKLNFLKDIIGDKYSLINFSKNDRIIYIINSIAQKNSPVKSSYFMKKFKISYSTLIKDLNFLKNFLKSFDLNLNVKKGYGIYVEGNEEKIREVLSYIIYEKFSEDELYTQIKNVFSNDDNTKYGILKFIDEHTIKFCNEIIVSSINQFNINPSKKSYMCVLIHLCLSVKRLNENLFCEFEKNFVDKFRESNEFIVSQFIMNEVCIKLSKNLKDGDVCYLAMHLKSNNFCKTNTLFDEFDFKNLDKMKLACDIVRKVEEILNIHLMDCNGLIENLTSHLGPALSRLIMKMNIRNTFLHMMKNDYKEFYDATKEACSFIENIVSYKIPESEIGYITMHIVAGYESKLQSTFKYRALICCETKRVCVFLCNKIINEFPNILIVGIVNSSNLMEEIKLKNVDFVISTENIQGYDNYIKVHGKFTQKDILIISSKLKELLKTKRIEIMNCKNIKPQIIDIDFINLLGESVKLICDKFKLRKLDFKGNIKSLIKEVVFNTVDKNKNEIYLEVLNRELLSKTFVKEMELIIMHAISDFSNELFIGVYFLNNKIKIYDGDLKIIFYFIIPRKFNFEIFRNLIGEITSDLVKDNKFIKLILKNDFNEVKLHVENILNRYYVSQLKEHIKKFENGRIN